MYNYSRHLSLFFPARLPLYARNLVIFVFCVDFLFIFIHLVVYGAFYLGQIPDLETFKDFSLLHDRSYPELFNYLKLLFITVVLLAIFRYTRSPVFLILALCYVYVFLDDSLRFHERGGVIVDRALNLQATVGAWSLYLGEFIIFAAAGSVFFVSLAIGWYYAEAVYRRFTMTFAALLLLLAFFAVFINSIVSKLVSDTNRVLRGVVDVIEDGGELLVTALSCWVALSVFYHLCPPPPLHSRPADLK